MKSMLMKVMDRSMHAGLEGKRVGGGVPEEQQVAYL